MAENRMEYRHFPTRQRLLNGITRTAGGCWLFGGMKNMHGYGVIRAHDIGYKSQQLAHRISWEIYNSQKPGECKVLHKCDTRDCINPEHLFLGDHKDNMRDMSNKCRHPNKRIPFSIVEQIRGDFRSGMTLGAISSRYNIARSTACRFVNNTARKDS